MKVQSESKVGETKDTEWYRGSDRTQTPESSLDYLFAIMGFIFFGTKNRFILRKKYFSTGLSGV